MSSGEEIQVATDSSGFPYAFRWRKRTYRIAKVRECWRLIGKWWDGDGEKTYFRLECPNRAVFEIFYDHGKSCWLLARVED